MFGIHANQISKIIKNQHLGCLGVLHGQRRKNICKISNDNYAGQLSKMWKRKSVDKENFTTLQVARAWCL